MRFPVLEIVPHAPHPVTGELISVHERLPIAQPYTQQQEVLTRFTEEVAPLVRRELTTTLWGPHDQGRASGFMAAD